MNFNDIQDDTQLLLNFNSSQTNQDFTTKNIKSVINRVYEREVSLAKQEGTRLYFMATQDVTWEADALTFELPKFAQRAHILSIRDISDSSSEIGSAMVFSDYGAAGGPFWKDRKTLQYGDSAPTSDITLRFFFQAVPEPLVNDEDEPELIAQDFRELLSWSAAIRFRRMGDESAPQEWILERDEIRTDFWKHVSRGRPNDSVPWIRPSESDLTSIIY